MTTPEVVRCPDGHFRRVIYGLGPYIADYPEQALLACIVQGWCPKCVAYYIDWQPSTARTLLILILLTTTRCTATPDNLEGESIPRCREHTEELVRLFELDVLWDEYGLVGDIVVGAVV